METKINNKVKPILSVVCIALFLVLVYLGDIMIRPGSSMKMLITVIEKGSIFALVAASMNLLNGFTGLFSLGQAGFMLIGAYTYAIFTIPAASHDKVYQYFLWSSGYFSACKPNPMLVVKFVNLLLIKLNTLRIHREIRKFFLVVITNKQIFSVCHEV